STTSPTRSFPGGSPSWRSRSPGGTSRGRCSEGRSISPSIGPRDSRSEAGKRPFHRRRTDRNRSGPSVVPPTMARHPLYVVDAFTSTPFTGNPAAVCLLREPCDADVLQRIAAEMNLSETAFVTAADGDLFAASAFELRWFSPALEVNLCGHATL